MHIKTFTFPVDGGGVAALLGGGGLPPMLDIPPDADDETMVELAIALSLQDHDAPPNLQGLVNLQALQNLAGPALQVRRIYFFSIFH